MLIQYYTVDGQEVSYQTVADVPTMEDVNNVAIMYATKRPNVLPEYIFVSVRIYGQFVAQFNMYPSIQMCSLKDPWTMMQMMTAVGPLIIRCMPMAYDAKLFLIGREDDYERYDLDRVFEEVVLKDCKRE